jgi:hypothetical protein
VIDVGVHYPIEEDPARCFCGAARADRNAVMMHVLDRGRQVLASASPAELGGLLDLVLDRPHSLPIDDVARQAAARALQRHGGFTEIVRASMWLHWHPDGSLDPGLGMIKLDRQPTVSRSDRGFLSVLRSMTSRPYSQPPAYDDLVALATDTRVISAADRLLLADAIGEWLPGDPPADAEQADTYRLPTAPTAADITTGARIQLSGLAHTPWPERQAAARLLREQLIRTVEPPTTVEQARRRATAIASPASARPAPHLTAAVAMLAVTAYAVALDHDRPVEEIAPTEIRRWLAEPGLPDLLDRALAGTTAANWQATVPGPDGDQQHLDAAREHAADLVQAEITAVEQQVQPGDAVLVRTLDTGPHGEIYWTATIDGAPCWQSDGPQPSVLYLVRIASPVRMHHSDWVAPDGILRDYDPDDTRGAGTRYNAVRCATADLRRAAYLAAERPDLALADLGKRFLRYQPQPDIYTIMVRAFVDLLSVKNRRLPAVVGDSGAQLLEAMKPLIAKAEQPYSPAEQARAAAHLTDAASKAEALGCIL